MSNITKKIASQITKALLEKRQNACNQIEQDFVEKVREIALSRVPKNIMELFLVQKEWLNKGDSIQLTGGGFNYDTVYLEKPIPSSSYNSRITIMINDEEAKPLMKLHTDCLKVKKKLKDDFAKIEATLLSLKSYKNISSQFPEAITLLPKVEKTEIANIEQVRALIKEDI